MKSLGQVFKQRFIQPLVAFLKQGLSPEKLALTVAVGTALSISPFVGTTTIFCAFAAFAFRLNMGAIQLVNYAAFPLQLFLMVPFIQAGVWIFGADALPFTQGEIRHLAETDPFEIISRLWRYLLMGLVAWMIALIPVGWLLYRLCLPVFRRIDERRKRGQEEVV